MFDNEDAARIAIDSVLSWFKEHNESVEKVVFCTYKNVDYLAYNKAMKEKHAFYIPDGIPDSNESISPEISEAPSAEIRDDAVTLD